MKESETYDQYIQQKLESLHFPDEHESWKRMELLLKKDKKRRPLLFIPIGCLGILLLTAGSLYLFYSSSNKSYVHKSFSTNRKDDLSKSDINRSNKNKYERKNTIVNTDHAFLNESKLKSKKSNHQTKYRTIPISIREKFKINKMIRQKKNADPIYTDNNLEKAIHFHSDPIPPLTFVKPQHFPLHIVKKDIIIVNKKNPHENKSNYELVLGLGLSQQIPVNGQSFVPYGNDGRKLSVSDYLPYLYGVYKLNSKISMEAQFRYGAPNYVKEVVYNQQKIDSFATQAHSYRYTVQKTYYHQLQLGINYRVSKKIEIGSGIQLNFFKNAIVKREYVLKDLILNKDSIINSYVLVAKSDSFFTRQHIDLNFKVNYQLKKFDLGIKGGIPLSSLLNYQDALGALKQEKSWYLNLYLRVPILKLHGKANH